MSDPEVPRTAEEADPALRLARLLERIESDFTYHAPAPDQIPLFNHLRAEARGLARTIAHVVPPSREQSLALTKLEEAVMWANAGIARHGT